MPEGLRHSWEVSSAAEIGKVRSVWELLGRELGQKGRVCYIMKICLEVWGW
jgi:hypothetical protein